MNRYTDTFMLNCICLLFMARYSALQYTGPISPEVYAEMYKLWAGIRDFGVEIKIIPECKVYSISEYRK